MIGNLVVYNMILYGVPTLIIIGLIIWCRNEYKEYRKIDDIFRSRK